MVINNGVTNIDIFPLIPFSGVDVNVYVIHKATKTEVTNLVSVTINGQKVNVPLPTLTPISDVSQDMDELVIRILQAGILVYEYVGYWISGSVDEYRQWKQWDVTNPNNHEWVTL